MNYVLLLRKMLETGRYNQTELAKRLGVTQPTVSRWLRGAEPELENYAAITAEAERLGVVGDPVVDSDDSAPAPNRTVRVVGYVGAGAAAHFYAVAQGDLDEVEAPDGCTTETVAVEIRGESLGSLFDRWLVFYDDVRRPVTPDLIGRLSVVYLGPGFLVGLGLLLTGLGEGINRPKVTIFIETGRPLTSGVAEGHPWQPSILGCLLDVSGAALFCLGIWRLL